MHEFSPLDLVRAHSWTGAFFTTYSLSLAYFEAVVLDALVRQRVQDVTIMADVAGVRAALSEHGARQAGRAYQVEPVVVDHGCFHAKLMVLTSQETAHLTVGSGNLTVGGWGGNTECIEHLHPAFAADAFDDAADFLEALAKGPRHGAIDTCEKLARDLRAAASAGGRRSGDIRLVSNIERPIFDQLAAYVQELGGATRLTVVSPFFDTAGGAVDKLCAAFGLSHVSVHAHPAGPVTGKIGAAWPQNAKVKVAAVTVKPFEASDHPLHAKAFEVLCRRGRVLMSGSANATHAALGYGGNVELSVIRIQREVLMGWRLTPAAPITSVPVPPDEESDEAAKGGVLRAVMQAGILCGEILTRFPTGPAVVSLLTGMGPKDLANTIVAVDGSFTISARALEREGIQARRLVLRVRSTKCDQFADGFISFPEVAEITRRGGRATAHLLAIVFGTETPEDIAAVMAWLYENPEHLHHRSSGGHQEQPGKDDDATVNVWNLLHRTSDSPGDEGEGGAPPAWIRFIDQVLASFREARGPIAETVDSSDPEYDEDDEEIPPPSPQPPNTKEAVANFDDVFTLLLGEDGGHQNLGLALHLSQYVIDRIDMLAPEAEPFLLRLVRALSTATVEEADCQAMAASVLVATASRHQGVYPAAVLREARRRLLRLQVPIDGNVPDLGPVHGFAQRLTPDMDAPALWAAIGQVRTYQEEVSLFAKAPPGSLTDADLPALSSLPEWKALRQEHPSRVAYSDKPVKACPVCFRNLPAFELHRLEQIGIGRALNCCSRFILCGVI